MDEINRRVVRYWTARAHDFASVRKNELKNSITERWLDEFGKFFQTILPLIFLMSEPEAAILPYCFQSSDTE